MELGALVGPCIVCAISWVTPSNKLLSANQLLLPFLLRAAKLSSNPFQPPPC
jgi:hypothetical protein